MPRTPKSSLRDLQLPVADRTLRALARAGWTVADVEAVAELCGPRTATVLEGVQRGDWPDQAAGTVLAWLRAGGQPMLEAMGTPDLHRRQVHGMADWSRTYGELGPLAHSAGLTLAETAHLLAAGALTRAALEQRALGREPAPVLSSWSDALRV